MAELEVLLINQADFDCIAQVAKHCDWEKLCIYIREQQNLSLVPKFGYCIYKKLLTYHQYTIDQNLAATGWTEEQLEIIQNLFEGGEYTACDGEPKYHFGIKRILIHWAYGAYAYRGSATDTPFGQVQKLNQDSVPVPLDDLKKLNFDHRNTAQEYFTMTKEYICAKKEDDPLKECNPKVCIKDCECSHCKKHPRRQTLKNRNDKFYTIEREY